MIISCGVNVVYPRWQVGQQIPDVEVELATVDGGFASVKSVLGSGKSILLGMPGAYTPTCNDVHLPGYYRAAAEMRSLGVDNIALVTTNDRFVNAKWQEDMEACMGVPQGEGPVLMLSDARGDLAESLGLIGYLGRALGVRSKRFALLVENGVVKYKAVDEGSERLETTSAEEMLNYLRSSPGGGGGGFPLLQIGVAFFAFFVFFVTNVL